MADVELILKVDNVGAVTSIKETELALAELKNTAEGGGEDQITLLKKQISILQEFKKKTKEAETTQEEYNEAMNQTASTSDRAGASVSGVGKKLGSLAAIITLVVAGLRSLATAFKETNAGMNIMIKTGSVFRQLMYDIVTLNFRNGDSMKKGLEIAKMEIALRRQQIADIKSLANYQVIYNRYMADANNTNKNALDRVAALTSATEVYNTIMDKKVANAREEWLLANEDLAMKPKNHKLQLKTNELYAAYILLQQEQILNNERLQEQELGIKSESYEKAKEKYLAEIQAANDAYDKRLADQKKFQDMAIKLLDEYDQAYIDSLEGSEKLAAQRDYELKAIESFRSEMEKLGTLTEDQKEKFKTLGMYVWKAFFEGLQEQEDSEDLNIVDELIRKFDEDWKAQQHEENATILDLIIGDVEKQEKIKEDAIAVAKQVSYELVSILDQTYAKRVYDAERNYDLITEKLNFAQDALDKEIELMKAGYASNVALKRKEVEAIRQEQEKALIDQKKAYDKYQAIELAIQSVNLATSITSLFKDEIKSKGAYGLITGALAVGTFLVLWDQYKKQAQETTKLAKGGSGDSTGMITGKSHSEGGEHFLDHVEVEGGEKWGVLSKRASGKYGEAFDYMVDSFNKDRIPDIAPQVANIVTVDNDGSNSRLDKVIAEQRKLNDKWGKDTRVMVAGGKRIITRGNKTRVIG